MKEVLVDINDITYSREIYESKPKYFVGAFIYIFFVIIIGILVWTYFGEVDIVIKGSGIVRPNQNVSTLKTQYSGKLSEVNVSEGQHVKQSELLYIIEHDALLLKKEELNAQIEDLKNRLDSLKIYENSIDRGENLFKYTQAYDDYYGAKYENYKINMEYLAYQQSSSKLQLEQSNQVHEIEQQLVSLKEELAALKAFKESIQEGKNYIEHPVYARKYQDYMNQMEQYTNEYDYEKGQYEKSKQLFSSGIISEKEFELIRYNFENKGLLFEQFKNNYILDIESQIQLTQKNIEQNEAKLQQALITNELVINEDEHGKLAMEKYHSDTIVAIKDEIKQCEEQKKVLENELENLEIQINQALIRAPISGIANILSKVSVGDYMMAGTELMTIIPDNETAYIVEIALPNQDVAGIHVGDKIKFQFHALPYREYGEFSGVVTNISSDIKVSNSYGSYYLVEAILEQNQGVSYKGEKREIKVGMSCDAFVITEQKKILYWLLEKINLRN